MSVVFAAAWLLLQAERGPHAEVEVRTVPALGEARGQAEWADYVGPLTIQVRASLPAGSSHRRGAKVRVQLDERGYVVFERTLPLPSTAAQEVTLLFAVPERRGAWCGPFDIEVTLQLDGRVLPLADRTHTFRCVLAE